MKQSFESVGNFVIGLLTGAAGIGLGCLTRDMPPNSPAFWLFVGCTCFTVLVLALVAVIVMDGVIDHRKASRLWPFTVAVTTAQPATIVATPQRPGPRKNPPRPRDKPRVAVIDGTLSPIDRCYYLDTYFSSGELPHLLRENEFNVVSTYESDRGGSSHEGQLRFAARNRRRIITCHTTFLDFDEQGIPHAGIIHAPRGIEWHPGDPAVCLMLARGREGMNTRAELILYVLCACVRLLARGQAMRLLGITDEANFRRFVADLVARGLVSQITVWAKPVPEMREPLLTSLDGVVPVDISILGERADKVLRAAFSDVLKIARARWAGVSALPTACLVATKRAGDLFGVRRTGHPTMPLQCSHDLTVAGVYLTKFAELVEGKCWVGEDYPEIGGFQNMIPDAVIYSQGRPEKVIEIVGEDYTHIKLAQLAHQCHARALPYELW